MVLSELTNKELKSILRENDVRNYSKLNKKGLLKKVNQLIKEQNGGKTGNGKNIKKKYRLRGGSPKKSENNSVAASVDAPVTATAVNSDATTNQSATAAVAAAPPTQGVNLATAPPTKNASVASAPPLNESESPSTGNKYLNAYQNPKDPKNVRLVNPELGSNPPEQVINNKKNNAQNNAQNNTNTNKPKDECGACSIL